MNKTCQLQKKNREKNCVMRHAKVCFTYCLSKSHASVFYFSREASFASDYIWLPNGVKSWYKLR